MADSYLEFSELIENLTDQEQAWLEDQLRPIVVFGDSQYDEDRVPPELAEKEPDWFGVRFLRDKPDHDPAWDGLGFEYSFLEAEPGKGLGRRLCLYAEDWGNPENAACLVQKFLKTFRPQGCWSLGYATTCSKPRPGSFGGGSVFVTAEEIRHQDAGDFLEEQEAAFRHSLHGEAPDV